ncbi:MAG TPA: hypothetical protein VNE83_05235 [Terriglobales bacterium]|nr:hypothetical protein [Terriglobales bacterium]
MASVAGPWAELNRELEEFCAGAAAHAAAPEQWCTPERVRAVQALLDRGAEVLAQAPPPLEEVRAARARYAANLRRLLELMQALQRGLTAFAERLEGSRQHLAAVRTWLDCHL